MKKDQTISLVWLFVAMLLSIETLRALPLGSWHNPGPGFFPLGAGIFLGLLSGLNFLRSVLSKSPDAKERWVPKRWKTLALVMAALLAYASSLETVGFLIGTFLLMTFLFRAVEPQRWVVAIGGGALVSVATYAIFEVWLRTQLPRGILGF